MQLLDRLEIYQGLGIPEVWVWKQGRLTIQLFDQESTAYTEVQQSQFFPDLDLTILVSFIKP